MQNKFRKWNNVDIGMVATSYVAWLYDRRREALQFCKLEGWGEIHAFILKIRRKTQVPVFCLGKMLVWSDIKCVIFDLTCQVVQLNCLQKNIIMLLAAESFEL